MRGSELIKSESRGVGRAGPAETPFELRWLEKGQEESGNPNGEMTAAMSAQPHF